MTDPKHPSNSTPPHNSVLVDGRGQEVEWSPIAFLEDLSPVDDVDYIVSRIEQGYGPKVTRFDRHAYFVHTRFYVLLDDIELAAPGAITWNFHGPKGAEMTAEAPAAIANGRAQLRIIPQGTVELVCTRRDDHLLPRLQWDTVAEVKAARVAWLLLPERAAASSAPPSVELHQEFVVVSDGGKEWRLPIVRRRVPHRSSMTLIRDSGQ